MPPAEINRERMRGRRWERKRGASASCRRIKSRSDGGDGIPCVTFHYVREVGGQFTPGKKPFRSLVHSSPSRSLRNLLFILSSLIIISSCVFPYFGILILQAFLTLRYVSNLHTSSSFIMFSQIFRLPEKKQPSFGLIDKSLF